MKLWHRLIAWLLDRKIQREHQELAKYVRRSAYEINAWKQDIAFLEESRDFHRSLLGGQAVASSKVVPIGDVTEATYPTLPSRQNAG